MPRSLGVRQLPSKRCGCERCRSTYPTPERKSTKNCTGSWQARWYDEDGARQAATRKKKDDALAARTAALAAIDAGTYMDPKRGLITLADWRDSVLKGRRVEASSADRDYQHWSKHIEPRWGAKPLRAIRHQPVQNWIVELEDSGLAVRTVRTILGSLGVLMEAARLDQRIEVNPCGDVTVRSEKVRGQTQKAEKPPTIEQVQLAVKQIRPRTGRGLGRDLYSRLPLVILETGMRWGETIGLLPDCLDLDADEIWVRRVVEQVGRVRRLREYPKSEASTRCIPLTRAARQLFAEHLEEQPAVDGLPIFRTLEDKLISRSTYRDRVWMPATIESGIHREYTRPSGVREHWPSLHDIRHTFASRLENAGLPDSVLKEVLGHERPKGRDVTWTYKHAPQEYRALVLAALGDEPTGPVTPLVRPLRLAG
jgi:integrase